MWFRSDDRLVSEEYTFKINTKEELTPIYSLLWIYSSNDAQIIYQTHNYFECVKRLDLIQEKLGCYKEQLIDLRQGGVDVYFYEKNKQEEIEEVETNPITTPSEEEIMDYLKNNDFEPYEEYKKNKELPKIEKKAPIISTPEELQQKLHEYRIANGWNMTEASKSLGIAPMTALGWFKGNNLPSQKKHRDLLAKTLNVRFERDM